MRRQLITAAALAALSLIAAASPSSADEPPEPTEPAGPSDTERLEWALNTHVTGTWVRARPGATLEIGGRAVAQPFDEDLAFERLAHPDPERVRVIVSAFNASIAAFLDRRELMTVAARAALLHPEARAARAWPGPETVGVHLDPGAPIAVAGRRGELVRASLIADKVTARGWIRADAVAVQWAGPAIARPEGEARIVVAGGPLALAVRPGGRPFVTIGDLASTEITVLSRRGSQLLISCPLEHGHAVGWSPEKSTRDARLGGMFGLGTIGSRRLDGPTLAAGTPLHDSPGGERIGVVTARNVFAEISRRGDWVEIRVPGHAGSFELWARDTSPPR
jgi:hypothetical protein